MICKNVSQREREHRVSSALHSARMSLTSPAYTQPYGAETVAWAADGSLQLQPSPPFPSWRGNKQPYAILKFVSREKSGMLGWK